MAYSGNYYMKYFWLKHFKYPLLFLALFLFFFIPTILSSYLLHIAILILFFSFLGSSWNIVGGYTGQFSFGHSGFFGVGAYTSTLLYIKFKISPWIGMFVGGIFGAGLGAFIGFLTFRYKLKGVFFALATFAFAEMLRIITVNCEFVGGASGLLIPLKKIDSYQEFQFIGKLPYYYIILLMVILILFVSYKLENSKLGYYFNAIREDEEAAGSLGINVLRYKVISLVISSFFTSLGGTFYAQYIYYIDPEITFGINMTVEMIIRPILGGVGTVFGPLIGSAVIESISELMRGLFIEYKGLHIMIYAAILIVVMIFFPRGLIGLLKKK